MSTKKQIVSQMLNDGTITAQQFEYVIALLQENPKQDIGVAIEKAKEFFSKEAQNDSSIDTLYLEEFDDLEDKPSETTNSVETIQIDGQPKMVM